MGRSGHCFDFFVRFQLGCWESLNLQMRLPGLNLSAIYYSEIVHSLNSPDTDEN